MILRPLRVVLVWIEGKNIPLPILLQSPHILIRILLTQLMNSVTVILAAAAAAAVAVAVAVAAVVVV